LRGKGQFEASPYIDLSQFATLPGKVHIELGALLCQSRGFGVRFECTETYSPVAIDIAPATKAAVPLSKILVCEACAAATPRIKLEVETMPSFAPKTLARSQPTPPKRWRS